MAKSNRVEPCIYQLKPILFWWIWKSKLQRFWVQICVNETIFGRRWYFKSQKPKTTGQISKLGLLNIIKLDQRGKPKWVEPSCVKSELLHILFCVVRASQHWIYFEKDIWSMLLDTIGNIGYSHAVAWWRQQFWGCEKHYVGLSPNSWGCMTNTSKPTCM